MDAVNTGGLIIGVVTTVMCIALVTFAAPAAKLFRHVQSQMYGERVGRIQSPGMVRLAAIPGIGLGVAMIVMALLGMFGTHPPAS
jgi:hypothetical protein